MGVSIDPVFWESLCSVRGFTLICQSWLRRPTWAGGLYPPRNNSSIRQMMMLQCLSVWLSLTHIDVNHSLLQLATALALVCPVYARNKQWSLYNTTGTYTCIPLYSRPKHIASQLPMCLCQGIVWSSLPPLPHSEHALLIWVQRSHRTRVRSSQGQMNK